MLIKIFTFYCFLQLPINDKVIDMPPISAGLVVSDSINVWSMPDSNFPIVGRLHFAEPFYIYERKEFYLNPRQTKFWFKIKSPYSNISGWIINFSALESNIKLVNIEKSEFIGLYYEVASHLFSKNGDNYDRAEYLLNKILKENPNQPMLVPEAYTGAPYYRNSTILSLELLGRIYVEKKDYDKAIGFYESAFNNKYATILDTVVIQTMLIRLANNMVIDRNDFKRPMEILHYIIKTYPFKKYVFSEGIDYPDIDAANSVINAYLKETQNMDMVIKESDIIISESPNPAVKLIAAQGKTIALIKKEKYNDAIDYVYKIINQYPAILVPVFKRDENYTMNYISESAVSLINNGYYNPAKLFIKKIINSYPQTLSLLPEQNNYYCIQLISMVLNALVDLNNKDELTQFIEIFKDNLSTYYDFKDYHPEGSLTYQLWIKGKKDYNWNGKIDLTKWPKN